MICSLLRRKERRMEDTQDRHLHYNDKGEPIYLSGLRGIISRQKQNIKT